MWRDRRHAGQELAEALTEYRRTEDLVVLAIPRGGVILGDVVAKTLNAPLDVIIPRKLGSPFNPELAIGAITADGSRVLDQDLIDRLGVSPDYLEREIKAQTEEIERRSKSYRGARPPLNVKGKTVILVDDGVATGATTVAAIKSLRREQPKELVLAIPVGPPDTVAKLKVEVDRLVCLETPTAFFAVGQFYEVFEQTTDEEVIAILSVHNTKRV